MLGGFKEESRRLDIDIGDDHQVDELSLSPVFRTVSFVVGLGDQMAITGLTITAFLDDRRVAKTISDTMGRVEIELIERSHVLEISYPGYDRQEIRLEWDEDDAEFRIDGVSLPDVPTLILSRSKSPLFLAELQSKVAPKQTVVLDIEGGTPPYAVSFKNMPPASGSGAFITGTQVHLGDIGRTQETIVVTDSVGETIDRTIEVGAALVIEPAATTVAPGTAHRFRAFGGRPPYRFSSPTFTGLAIDPMTGIAIAPNEGARTRVVVEDANGAQAIAVLVTQRITNEAISPMLIERAALRGQSKHEIIAVNGAHNQIKVYTSDTMGLLSLHSMIALPESEQVDDLARVPRGHPIPNSPIENNSNPEDDHGYWPPKPKPWPQDYQRPDNEIWPEESNGRPMTSPSVDGSRTEDEDVLPERPEQLAYLSNGAVSAIGIIGSDDSGDIAEIARHSLDTDTGRAISVGLIDGETYIVVLTLAEIIVFKWSGTTLEETLRLAHSGRNVVGVGPAFMHRDLTGDGRPDLIYMSQRKNETDRWSEIHLVPSLYTFGQRPCLAQCPPLQPVDMPGYLGT